MHQSSDRAQGLEPVLLLSIGARVMLRKNLWVRGGLVDGATGTVRAIIYPAHAQPHELPLCVMVEFDDYNGHTIRDRLFPIVPVTVTWNSNGTRCSRTQIPLTLACAISIHKCQGLTVDKAVIDIGETEFAAGLAYVGLSRARRLSDIILNPIYSGERFKSVSRTAAYAAKQQFVQWLYSIR